MIKDELKRLVLAKGQCSVFKKRVLYGRLRDLIWKASSSFSFFYFSFTFSLTHFLLLLIHFPRLRSKIEKILAPSPSFIIAISRTNWSCTRLILRAEKKEPFRQNWSLLIKQRVGTVQWTRIEVLANWSCVAVIISGITQHFAWYSVSISDNAQKINRFRHVSKNYWTIKETVFVKNWRERKRKC